MQNSQLNVSNVSNEYVNGCRLCIRDHFSFDEWEKIYPSLWKYVKYLSNKPVSYYEANVVELSKSSKWNGWLSTYIYKLALYRRITLPIDFMLSSKMQKDRSLIENLSVFEDLNYLIDKYYPEIFQMDKNDDIKKKEIKDHLERLVLRLWCSGYTLLKGPSENILINENVLIECLKYAGIDRKGYIYILGQMLELEPRSPVLNAPRRSKATPVLEREKRAWESIKPDRSINELFQNLHEYCFGSLLERVEHSKIVQKSIGINKYQRISLSKISYNTWAHHSSYFRKLIQLCNHLNISTIDELMYNGISRIFQLNEIIRWSKSYRNSFRSTLRQFLDYYINLHNLDLKLDSIFPRSFRRAPTTFGKILNLGKATELIQTLLTDEKGIIDENDILQFRCRRACLIQLETGQRIGEVCLLLRKSLMENSAGDFWLHFHKTKKGKSLSVEVANDVVEWVNQLKNVSPNRKISAPENTAYTGDGLTEYRLFANSKNNGPLTNDTVNKFLYDLQKRLWVENSVSDAHFTTHDFRRLQAVYMVLSGKKKEEIQLKLGQSNTNSLIPYLATNNPKYQSIYKDIYQEGIWANITTTKENEADIELDTVLNQAHKMAENNNLEIFVTDLINKSLTETDDITISSTSFLPVNQVSAGFPRRTHNCIANEMLNCGHTELSCFKCKKYRPDSEMLEAHKAEIFRFMVLSLDGKSKAKKNKEEIKKELIYLRSDTIDENIRLSFSTLFERGYGLDKGEVEVIKESLWKKAKQYLKRHGKSMPSLTFREALKYLETGEINAEKI